jgi:hypothetical protein
MQLVGVMMIIYGILVAITIIGIIIAWLPIWMGVLLFQCAGQIERAHTADDADAMVMAMAKLKTYFTITGILTLIGLIFGALGILFGFGTAMMAASQMG